jgi:hypothetical protein
MLPPFSTSCMERAVSAITEFIYNIYLKHKCSCCVSTLSIKQCELTALGVSMPRRRLRAVFPGAAIVLISFFFITDKIRYQ